MKFRKSNLVGSTILWLVLVASPSGAAELVLNGLAMHTNFGQNQFLAAVFCETPTTSARELLLAPGAKVMELRVVADQIFPRRFKRMWIEGMAINSGAQELEQHAQHMVDFAQMLRIKLRVGDNLRIEKNANGVRVLVDGHELGVIPDPAFFDLLLRTWIGPVPLSTQLKNNLLAGGEVNEDLRRLYFATIPIPERIMAISAALAALPVPEGEATTEAVTASSSATPAAQPPAETPTPTSEPAPSAPAVTVAELPTEPASAATDAPEPPVEPVTAVVASAPGLVTEDDLFADDTILDDSDENLSAESLLSQQLYISKLTRWTGGYVEYPRRALRANQEGTVRLLVSINRKGEVIDVQYEEESQYRLLNEAAFEAINKASPYPAMPDVIAGESFAFTVPVVFRLE